MFYELKRNFKDFNHLFASRPVDPKQCAVLYRCEVSKSSGVFQKVVVARLWRVYRGLWNAEVWSDGDFVIAQGHSKGKAAQAAKFVLAGVDDGQKFQAPSCVW